MQPEIRMTSQSAQLSLSTHKVLRNTYMMLALTMIPTVLGAMVGVNMNFAFMAGSPIMSSLIFLGVVYGLFFGIEKTKDSGMGVALLLLLTGFLGLMLGPILQVALHLRNGGQLITMAAGGTGVIFLTLAGIASVTKKDFSFMGKFLMVGGILFMVAVVANIFLQLPVMSLTISAVAILLFSGFLLYHISSIIHGGETNYISATLSVYMAMYNIFLSLLQLLMAFAGDRR
jgi:FtsH-binding integral membrane protein